MAHRLVILIVDPYAPSGQALAEMLAERNHDVTQVRTAAEAIAEAQQRPFDAAIIDLNDAEDGVAARQLRTRNPSIRIAFTDAWVVESVTDPQRGAAKHRSWLRTEFQGTVFVKPLSTDRILAWVEG